MGAKPIAPARCRSTHFRYARVLPSRCHVSHGWRHLLLHHPRTRRRVGGIRDRDAPGYREPIRRRDMHFGPALRHLVRLFFRVRLRAVPRHARGAAERAWHAGGWAGHHQSVPSQDARIFRHQRAIRHWAYPRIASVDEGLLQCGPPGREEGNATYFVTREAALQSIDDFCRTAATQDTPLGPFSSVEGEMILKVQEDAR